MAIGNYWECVLPEGTEAPPLQRIVSESTMLAEQHFTSWRFEPNGQNVGGAEFAFMGTPAGEMRAVVHLVKPQGRPQFYLHSTFPWLASGAPTVLTLWGVDTDHFGLEGFVDAAIGDGPRVKFFDPLFAVNKEKYRPGAEYNFTLGGVSLDLALATPKPVRITNPETVAQMRKAERSATGTMGSSPDYIEVDTSQAKMLVRAAEDASDYYFFQGLVRTIQSAAFLDRPFLVFRTAVVDLDGDDLAVDIYIDRAPVSGAPYPHCRGRSLRNALVAGMPYRRPSRPGERLNEGSGVVCEHADLLSSCAPMVGFTANLLAMWPRIHD